MSFPVKGRPGLVLSEMKLIKGHGIESDINRDSKRQVSLLSGEAQRWKNTTPVCGLCFKKFKANILIDGLPDKLAEGSLILIGKIVLRISGKRKKCFDECQLYSNNIPCRLSQNAAFASVEQGGTVRLGDSVIIE